MPIISFAMDLPERYHKRLGKTFTVTYSSRNLLSILTTLSQPDSAFIGQLGNFIQHTLEAQGVLFQEITGDPNTMPVLNTYYHNKTQVVDLQAMDPEYTSPGLSRLQVLLELAAAENLEHPACSLCIYPHALTSEKYQKQLDELYTLKAEALMQALLDAIDADRALKDEILNMTPKTTSFYKEDIQRIACHRLSPKITSIPSQVIARHLDADFTFDYHATVVDAFKDDGWGISAYEHPDHSINYHVPNAIGDMMDQMTNAQLFCVKESRAQFAPHIIKINSGASVISYTISHFTLTQLKMLIRAGLESKRLQKEYVSAQFMTQDVKSNAEDLLIDEQLKHLSAIVYTTAFKLIYPALSQDLQIKLSDLIKAKWYDGRLNLNWNTPED